MISKAAIISIGDELLIGQVQDTNSTYLSGHLSDMGIQVVERLTIGDGIHALADALDYIKSKVDLIITTGGLGPTDDDQTKQALAQYFRTSLKRDEVTALHIQDRMKAFLKADEIKGELLESNLRQADIPSNAEALFNPQGSAPGIYIQEGNLYLISLPGVPFEVQAIMENGGWELIQSKTKANLQQYNLIVYGIPESKLSLELRDFEKGLPDGMNLAYLPTTYYIRLRLTDRKNNPDFDEYSQQLLDAVKPYLLVEGDDFIGTLMRLLIDNALIITTAESCTGGGVASMICDQSGASTIFHESLVSYANKVKIEKLGVPQEVIDKDGAVSIPCVEAMAQGQLKNSDADYALSISGILGPSGGTSQKPLGLVYMAITDKSGKIWTRKISARWNRAVNKDYTIHQALIFLYKTLQEEGYAVKSNA